MSMRVARFLIVRGARNSRLPSSHCCCCFATGACGCLHATHRIVSRARGETGGSEAGGIASSTAIWARAHLICGMCVCWGMCGDVCGVGSMCGVTTKKRGRVVAEQALSSALAIRTHAHNTEVISTRPPHSIEIDRPNAPRGRRSIESSIDQIDPDRSKGRVCVCQFCQVSFLSLTHHHHHRLKQLTAPPPQRTCVPSTNLNPPAHHQSTPHTPQVARRSAIQSDNRPCRTSRLFNLNSIRSINRYTPRSQLEAG
jgi:hypothetical protein